MTATEVSEYLYNEKNISLSPVSCGKILNKMFTNKRIRVGRTVKTMYFIQEK